MPTARTRPIPGGVWSATPTPFTDQMRIDTVSVRKMIEHHLRLGVKGLFLAGTCGEGPWMPNRERRTLVAATSKCSKGRLHLAVQVTDNSAARILENAREARDHGAEIAVIAPPSSVMNPTPARLLDLYRGAIRDCPLPVGIYDRGSFGPVVVPNTVLRKIYDEPNVVMVKDSSTDPVRRRIALAARRRRPGLTLLNGWEFNCVDYLTAGYDGLLLGGGIFNGYLANQIMVAVSAGDLKRAQALQRRMNRLMYAVYGGRKIKCWLSGEKRLLVEMGIFRTWKSFLRYPLTASCVKAIRRVLDRDSDVLLPSGTAGSSRKG